MDKKSGRIEWKNEQAKKHYGKSYIALCADRKRVIDQIYEIIELEKQNSKLNCRS